MHKLSVTARRDLSAVAVLSACFGVMLALTHPLGDFPLNDDWAYAIPVRHMLAGDGLRFTNWQSMPLLVQVLLGSLTSLFTGFSFTTLRLTTLASGLGATLAFYALLVVCGARRGYAFVAALCLLVNPIFLALAHTFMTDVPFLALALASSALLLKGDQQRDARYVFAGCALALLATFIRQLALFIPLAFLVQRCARRQQNLPGLARAASPLLLTAALLFGYEVVLEKTGNLPGHYRDKSVALADSLSALSHFHFGVLGQLGLRALLSMVYCGLFFLPLMAPLAVAQFRRSGSRGRRILLAGGLLALLTTALLVLFDRALPCLGNVLQREGLGPRTLDGAMHRPLSRGFDWLWPSVTFVACAAALLLFDSARSGLRAVWHWLRAPRHPYARSTRPVFALVLLSCSFLPLGLAFAPLFDRYVLWFAPLLLVVCVRQQQIIWRRYERQALAIGCALALCSAAISVCLVHDYMSWNRERWVALHYLNAQIGVPSSGIDGGFEYNHFDAHIQPTLPLDYADPQTDSQRFRARKYAVVFEAGASDLVLGAFSWDAWMPLAPHQILAVRRERAFRSTR